MTVSRSAIEAKNDLDHIVGEVQRLMLRLQDHDDIAVADSLATIYVRAHQALSRL